MYEKYLSVLWKKFVFNDNVLKIVGVNGLVK